MLKAFFRSAPLTQGALLAAATVLFLMLGVQPVSNIVLNTYALAANHFFAGESPYGIPPAGTPLDIFPYPLLWPMMFGGLMRFALFFAAPQWQATLQLWLLLNAFVFWWGIARWIDLRERQPAGFFLVLIAAFAELDTTLWYCQTNALVLGMALLGLADYRDGKRVRAAAWLSFGAGLKVLPVFFIAPLALRDRRFRVSALVFLIVAILLPSFVVGFTRCLALQGEWLAVFFSYANGAGRLDLGTVLGQQGFGVLGFFLRNAILVVTTAFLFVEARSIPDARWISLGWTALLLASPRTELPTFIFAAPAMLFLYRSERGPARIVVAIASALISLRAWRLYQPTLPHSELKTYGVLALWLVAIAPTFVVLWRGALVTAGSLGRWRRLSR